MFKKRAKGAEIILALVAEKARAGPVSMTTADDIGSILI